MAFTRVLLPYDWNFRWPFLIEFVRHIDETENHYFRPNLQALLKSENPTTCFGQEVCPEKNWQETLKTLNNLVIYPSVIS